MKLELAQSYAEALLDQLSSACVRIEIKGSILRRKAEVGDIDLVCIPAIGEFTVPIYDMFQPAVTTHQVNHLEEAIGTLLAGGEWEFDPVVKRNGPRSKRLKHHVTGIGCDLSITDLRRWGVISTIRTGPGDFSKALVRYAHRQTMFVSDGLLHRHAPIFDAHGEVEPCPAGERCLRIIDTYEERDLFDALGLSWIEPGKRTVNMLYAVRPAEARAAEKP